MSVNEETSQPPRPRWLEWCEKNSAPKTHFYPRVRRELTRWQKRGPMTRRDWVRFYHWAAKNAVPRPEYEPKPPKLKKGEKPPPKKKEKKKKSFDAIMKYIVKLCNQLPRKARDKYEYPPEPKYPYSPKIDWKKPAHRDRGRPFEPPEVPATFQHIEVEIDFWSRLRFPIMRSALNYKPSPNVLRLAIPRVTPPEKEHCPIPDRPMEVVPSRHRMSYRQWAEHQRRLEYLAKPVLRPRFDYLA